MRVKESENKRSNDTVIVDFLDIDTSKITFAKPKPRGLGRAWRECRRVLASSVIKVCIWA